MLIYIGFDSDGAGEFRQRTDKAAPIRHKWNYLKENLKDNCDP